MLFIWLLWIIDIELSIRRLNSLCWNECIHTTMKCTMNTKGCWTRSLNSMIIDVNTNKSECKSIIILANLLFELSMILGVIKEILKIVWPLLNMRKVNLALKTAYAKVRIANSRVGKLFRNEI